MATQTKDFDVKTWLGQWIEQPQPALGGRKSDEFLDAASRIEMVAQMSQKAAAVMDVLGVWVRSERLPETAVIQFSIPLSSYR